MSVPNSKRRKLSSTGSTSLATKFPTASTLSKCSSPRVACISCRRAFNASKSGLVFCARCNSPTCTICSRTCTTRAPPSEQAQPLANKVTLSPRRSALSFNSLNTNSPRRGKRKSMKDGLDDDDHDATDNEADCDTSPGCRRTVCKFCCFENASSNAITCYDCCL